jgi:hypothetical protein
MRGNRTNPPNSSNMVSLLYNVLRQSSTYVIPNKAISPDQFKGSIIQLPERFAFLSIDGLGSLKFLTQTYATAIKTS